MTPRDPQQFLALKNTIPDDEARALFAQIYTKPLPPSKGIPTDVEELRKKVLSLEEQIKQTLYLRSEDVRRRWNPMIDRVELEVGDIRDSNPKSNYVVNGGFRIWNAALTLPLGWTATNAPTISRVSARTGSQGGNYAVRVASGVAAGSISRTFRVKPGAVYACAGFVYLGDSDTVATITLLDNGTGAVAKVLTLTAADNGVGTAGWFGFPRVGYNFLLETTSDASSCTITLESSINDTTDFSDFQVVQGPQVDADLWEPAPEDIESAPGVSYSDSYTPTGTGVLNITAVTPGLFTYTRTGSRVSVTGSVLVDPAALGACTFRLSLPIASNFAAVTNASGYLVIAQGGATGISGDCTAVVATDDILTGYICPDGNQRTAQVGFSYTII